VLIEALATTLLIQLVATATALALTPIAPRAAVEFGVDAHLIGYQISLIYFSGMFASALAGTLILRHGPVRIEQVALACFALGLLGLATAKLWAAVGASLLIGVGYGLQNPASSQILNRISPPARRSMIFSIKQAGVPLGAVAASLGMPLLDELTGWRTGLMICVAAPMLLIVYLGRHQAAEGHRPADSTSFFAGFVAEQRLVWDRSELRVLSLIGLLYSSAQLSLSAFAVLLLLEKGWSLLAAAAASGLIQLFGAVGRVFWGVIADRLGSGFTVLALIGLLSGAIMLAIPWLGSVPVLVQLAMLGLLGLCLSGWNGVAMAEMTRYCPASDTGRVIGGALVYTFLGVMLGPSSFAALYGYLGNYGLTFAFASAVMLIGAGAAALSKSQQDAGRTRFSSAREEK